jgi:hypothetical protein
VGSCPQNLLLLYKAGNFSNSTATERHQPCDTLHIPCFPMVGRPSRPNQRRNRLAVVTSGRQPGATAQGVTGRWCSCSSSTVVLLGSRSWLHGDIGHLFLFQSNAGYIRFHICAFTTINSSNAHTQIIQTLLFTTAASNITPLTRKQLAALPSTLVELTHTADYHTATV